MKSADLNTMLVDSYLKFLERLSPKLKLDLIAKLSLSVEKDVSMQQGAFVNSFGAWKSNNSAEEINSEIREARTFNRQTESL